MIAGGKTAEEAARQIDVSAPTCHRWKEQYGGADQNTVKRLKEFEKENSRLKKTRGRSSPGQRDAQGAGGGKVVSPARKREAVMHLESALQVSRCRTCKNITQPRSTQRYQARRPAQDAKLIAEFFIAMECAS